MRGIDRWFYRQPEWLQTAYYFFYLAVYFLWTLVLRWLIPLVMGVGVVLCSIAYVLHPSSHLPLGRWLCMFAFGGVFTLLGFYWFILFGGPTRKV